MSTLSINSSEADGDVRGRLEHKEVFELDADGGRQIT
jgi:hypothetical protein